LASLELKGVRKAFGATPILDDVSLTLESREFIAFLGPSGSGKSTLLRIIAGLESADAGEVWLEGRRIDTLPPGQRDIAMVFQHYALYPHMTARENMAFGLRNAKVERDEIDRRIGDAAVIMVTHDQAEAMTLADRIVVINDRRIQQVGAPMEIYSRPANTFVAQFVGSPAMTLARVELADGKGAASVKLGDGSIVQTGIARDGLPAGELRLGLRPEAVRVADGAATTSAKVELVERLGERTLVYARLPDGQPITAEDSAYSRLAIGDEVALAIDGEGAHIFGPDGTGYHRGAAA
jgi:ABC-type sugar transport system ATPase subunit